MASNSNPNPKYFKPCIIELHDGTVIEGYIAHDGLTLSFHRCDIEIRLNKLYPHRNRAGWYFNETKDRFIAERFGDEISLNPQFIYHHVKEIVS